MEFKYIKTGIKSEIGFIVLNRPDYHNALLPEMIFEIRKALTEFEGKNIRFLFFEGEGKSFCSGMDLHHMKNIANLAENENLRDAENLSEMFNQIYKFPKITVLFGQGNIFGGGLGFIGACDLCYCDQKTIFSFSEIKLGLIPAVISPYVIRKIGLQKAKELFLTGERFTASKAYTIGLITESIGNLDLEKKRKILNQLLENSPNAMNNIKSLMLQYELLSIEDSINKGNSKILASIRKHPEAVEVINAFF